MAQVVILTSMVPAPLPNVTLEPAINTDSIDSTRSTVSMDSSGKQSIDKIQESSLVNLSIRDQREEAENPNELSQIAQSERVVITTETSSSVPHFPKGQTINLVSESEPADAKILSWERRLELWEAAGEGHSKPLGSLLNSLQQVAMPGGTWVTPGDNAKALPAAYRKALMQYSPHKAHVGTGLSAAELALVTQRVTKVLKAAYEKEQQ